jgi:hypothetical protein
MSAKPQGEVAGSLPWDLGAMTSEELHAAYLELSGFVGWLRECDIDVPGCWYVHGWLIHRLAALLHWRDATLDPEVSAKAAADWWAALFALQREWQELHGHHGIHPPRDRPWADPIATPAFEDAVADAVRARRRTGPGLARW